MSGSPPPSPSTFLPNSQRTSPRNGWVFSWLLLAAALCGTPLRITAQESAQGDPDDLTMLSLEDLMGLSVEFTSASQEAQDPLKTSAAVFVLADQWQPTSDWELHSSWTSMELGFETDVSMGIQSLFHDGEPESHLSNVEWNDSLKLVRRF
jgi:hypothetical protein